MNFCVFVDVTTELIQPPMNTLCSKASKNVFVESFCLVFPLFDLSENLSQCNAWQGRGKTYLPSTGDLSLVLVVTGSVDWPLDPRFLLGKYRIVTALFVMEFADYQITINKQGS